MSDDDFNKRLKARADAVEALLATLLSAGVQPDEIARPMYSGWLVP